MTSLDMSNVMLCYVAALGLLIALAMVVAVCRLVWALLKPVLVTGGLALLALVLACRGLFGRGERPAMDRRLR